MNMISNPRAVHLSLSLLLFAGAASVQAQTSSRSIRPATQPAAPAAAPGAAGLGAPSPAGLASPTPSPGGLSSRFPAGLPSPLVPNLASPGTPPGNPPVGGDIARIPPPIGRGPAAAGLATAQAGGSAGLPHTALEIAQSFIGADANRDGELTRGEAQRLSSLPYSFEEMDRNHDGVLTRSEYEEAVR